MFEELRSALAFSVMPKTLKQDLPTSNFSSFFRPEENKQTPPKLGSQELLLAYSQMPWLRAVVNKIGKSVGQTNWKLFVDTSGPKNRAVRNHKIQRADFELRKTLINKEVDRSNLTEITDHPLLTMLAEGNESFMGMVGTQITQSHIDLVGEAFWILEFNGVGAPVAYWPLPPYWIKNFPTAKHPFYRISLGARQVEIPRSSIIKFIDPDPYDPYGRGTGIAKALGDELESDEYAAKHIKAFFFNRARPDIIISGDNLNPADTTRLEEKWLSKHLGFLNALRPHFISRKIDIKELGQSFSDMELITLRKYERDTIIQVYGIPPEKLGIVNESKRATISAADFFWTKDIILPRIEFIRTTLQDMLVPMFDDRLILDYESPVTEDKEFALETMKVTPHAFTENEWREQAGFESRGDSGDIRLVPLNSTEVPVDEIADNTRTPSTKPEEESTEVSNLSFDVDSGDFIKDVEEKIVDLMPKITGKVLDELKNRDTI